eukprot:5562708-Alexandrium_andersonii.AAC.1
MHAFVIEDAYLALPPAVAEPGTRAQLVRSLCGIRAAPSRWEALYTETLESFGFVWGKSSACRFRHPGRGAKCA